MITRRITSALCGLFLTLISSFVSAAALTFDFVQEFSGGQAPGGTSPWLTAEFNDATATAGDVRLTISASGLATGENVLQTYFNLDPLLDPNNLSFTYIGASSTGPSFTGSSTGADSLKADGDGKYDFLFDFPSGSGFDAGESVVIDISSTETINAFSFNFLSAPAGGHGPFLAAAHIQNTTGAGTGGSGWIAPAPIPVPAAIWLFGSGLIGLAGVARRKAA